MELAETAGLSEKIKVLLQLQFGMIDEGRAREALAAAEAAEIKAQERELAKRRAELDTIEPSEDVPDWPTVPPEDPR